MNRILVFMYCVHTVTVAGLPDKIYWTIIDLPLCPLINGGSIKLFCNTSAVGLQKATWMKQSDVILHNGFSFKPDKYTGKDINDGSILTIMNTTESDFNSSYTCLSDVHSYEDVLMANSSNFICLPQNTNITWTIIGRNISVQLKLERFFPVPKCRTMFGGYMLKMTQQESVHLQNWFYHGTLNITSKSDHDLCGGNLTVVCLFGSVYPDTIETKILQNCYGSELSGHTFELEGAIGVSILCVVLFAICYGFVAYRRKSQKEKSTTEEGLNESQSLKELETKANGHQTESTNEKVLNRTKNKITAQPRRQHFTL